MNVFSVVHPGSRDFLKNICQKCSMTVKELPEEEYEDLVSNLPWLDAEERVTAIDEDLYYILTDKTSGSALEKVHTVSPGQGIKAFQRLWVWFGCCSGMAIQERSRHVMNPQPPKQESELSAIFELDRSIVVG